jgi:uncharacterized protein
MSMLAHPEFEKAFEKSKDCKPYYLKKYAYLKDHGLLDNSKLADFRTLRESTVIDNLVNVQQVVFEATDSCNLNCTYCGFGEMYEVYDERVGKKINTRNAINLLKYIFNLKYKNKNSKLYISFYGGEALLNMNFIKQIVELTKQLNSDKELDIEYSLTTNATLIHKYIVFLVENKFHLLVSLDGSEENHSYRVFCKNKKNSFHKVIENLDLIKQNYPEYFSARIKFNAVLHNKNSVKEIYEFIYTRYNTIPRIAELNTGYIKTENKDIFERMFHNKWKSEEEYQKEESELFCITRRNSLRYKELTDFLKYMSVNYYISNITALLLVEEKGLPTSTCAPFSKKIFLTNENKLLPCEKINYKYSVGKVDGDIEIDTSEITRQYNYYYEHLKKFCQTCYAYRFCGACLFQINNIDKVNTEEFVCEHFQDQRIFKNKLNRIFSYLERYPKDFFQILENSLTE